MNNDIGTDYERFIAEQKKLRDDIKDIEDWVDGFPRGDSRPIAVSLKMYKWLLSLWKEDKDES